MVKSKRTVSRASSNPKLLPTVPGFAEGGKDIIGMRPALGRTNNNLLYAGLLGLVVVVGGLAYTNPRLIGTLLGRPQGPPASVTAQNVQPGQATTIQGAFNPPVPQAYYVVTNQQGQQVAAGSLGSNVSQFSQQIPATNLPSGSYTVTVSDQPSPGGPGPTGTVGPQSIGGIYPTTGSLQQGLVNNQLGASQSGPESISLT